MSSLFEELIQNIPAVFYRCANDDDWTMHHLSGAKILAGYPASDFIENSVRTFSSIIHLDDIDGIFKIVGEAIKQKTSWSIEYRIINSNGDIEWVAETGIAVYTDAGDIEFLDGFILDISERKCLQLEVEKTQESLTNSENFFRALMQSAADPIIVISKRGIIEEFNLAAETVFGYCAEEIIGQSVNSLIPVEHTDKYDNYLQQYLENREAKAIGIGKELKGRRKDGSLFAMHLSVSEIETIGGDCRFAGIVRDLTEQKRLESELSKAHKMEAVGQLAAGIAHEINTPTQFIGDNLHFLIDAFNELKKIAELSCQLVCLEDVGDEAALLKKQLKKAVYDSDIQYLLEDIPASLAESSDGIRRIAEIVKAMKEFSHPGSKNKESIDLNKIIESTVIVARNEWKYVAEIEMDLAEGLPMLECFPGEISQAILNMVVNAAHAIEARQTTEQRSDKGVIGINTSRENDHFYITISDTGCGISPENLDKVFDPFFTTKEVGKGTGQGLSMVYATIVDKHNGSIDVSSVLEEGTSMTIKLP